MNKKFLLIIPLLSIFFAIFISCKSHATNCLDSFATLEMNDGTKEMFAQNNILFYEPCLTTAAGMDQSFKVDPNVNPWYAEGDLIRNYAGGKGTAYIGKNKNAEAFNSTQEDEALDGMQYIYGEQFDITWNDGVPVFTKNSSSSTVKYYWVVLPDKAYNNAAGETYIATFEKISEPIYFIVLDTHACKDQADPNYCDWAASDPNNVVAGKNFLGAFTNRSGNPTSLYAVTGGLTGFHRVKGDSKILVPETEPGISSSAGASSSDCVGEFKHYSQSDPRWGSDSFGSSTIAKSGCGPTSFAMLATMLLNREILPSETAKVATDLGLYVPGAGAAWEITEKLAQHYDLEYGGETERTEEAVSQKLKEGWMIHVSGSGSSPFTGGGHYIGIRGITVEGKWLIADSAGKGAENSEKEWDPKDILSQNIQSGFRLIKSKTCSKSTCTTNNQNGLKDGGMNLEEAKQFMKAYQDEASKKATGTQFFQNAKIDDYGCKDGALNNCVSFSQWFINRYTSVGPTGSPTANGDKMVSTLLSANLGFEDSGNTPKAYAIMSKTPQHTGVVLGIDTANDKIIIGEASCGNGFGESKGLFWPDAHEYSLSEYTQSSFTYASTDKIRKMDGN